VALADTNYSAEQIIKTLENVAPMISIIRQQSAVIRELREALEEGKHYSFLSESYRDESNFLELADKALALSAPLVKKEGE
jgi:hypothetical protein